MQRPFDVETRHHRCDVAQHGGSGNDKGQHRTRCAPVPTERKIVRSQTARTKRFRSTDPCCTTKHVFFPVAQRQQPQSNLPWYRKFDMAPLSQQLRKFFSLVVHVKSCPHELLNAVLILCSLDHGQANRKPRSCGGRDQRHTKGEPVKICEMANTRKQQKHDDAEEGWSLLTG